MTLKQEIFRIIVLAFAIGFFLFEYIAAKTSKLIFFLYGIISLAIAIALMFYGTKKGLEPEDVKKRREWVEQGTTIFFIPLLYGLTLVLFVIGVVNYIDTKQTGPIIGLTIIAIIIAAFTRYVQSSLKNKKK